MDLGAFIQREKLQPIADYNGIVVPRSRGYRLMENERPILQGEIDDTLDYMEVDAVQSCCSQLFEYNGSFEVSTESVRLEERYLIKNPYYFQEHDDNDDAITDDRQYIGVRWDRLHGKKRKRVKYEIKRRRALIRHQYELYNHYAGMPGILYVHSRIGGPIWNQYKDAVINHPKYLDHADDPFDMTYCDLYFHVVIPENFVMEKQCVGDV